MLAAAAGAALVAGGTTVVRLSDPAFAEERPAAGVAPRADPMATVPPPALLVVPDPVGAAPAVAPDQTPPRRVRPAVADEPATAEPEPVPDEPPTVAPATAVAAEPTPRAEDPFDDRDEATTADSANPIDATPDSRDSDDGERADEERADDRPSLLGGLTEPLGVTCGGLLRTICS